MTITVGVMRPKGYIDKSIELTKSLNFDAIVCPLIEIQDNKDSNFNKFAKRVRNSKTDYVIFTSANGVDHTLQKIAEKEQFIKSLNNCRIAAIGPNTRCALEEQGISVSLMPDVYSSLGLVGIMKDVSGKHVDIVRSTHGAPVLVEKLLEKNALVHETCVYTLARPEGDCQKDFIKQVCGGSIDLLPFTSSMMVHNFMSTAREEQLLDSVLNQMNAHTLVGAIGLPTARVLEKYGVKKVIMPEKYLFKDLLLALEKEIREK